MIRLLRPTTAKRIVFFVVSDILLSLITLFSAYLLRFNFNIPPQFLEPFWTIAFLIIFIKSFFIIFFRNYTIIWRFYGLEDAKKLFLAHLTAYTVFTLFILMAHDFFFPFPRSVIVIDMVLSLVFLGGLRLSKRLYFGLSSHQNGIKPSLLVGISPSTANFIKSSLDGNIGYYPVAIAAVQEKNLNMIGSTIQNLKIIGLHQITESIQKYHITAAIIDGSLPREYLRNAYQLLSDAGITEIKRSNLLSEGGEPITAISIEELLARHPKDLDTKTIAASIQGKNVLITGAGGSIGSEIALQCQRFGSSRLILVDNSEYNLYQIGERLPNAVLRLCNVVDRHAVDNILTSETIDLIIHAAAYKHVPLCESNIAAAIENNIIGSRNVIDSAIANNVGKVVIISTDKAVRPTNVMGATKRVVELYAQNVDPKNSEIVSVRFGNVLGSSGSVIPKFKSQIESGGPLTITHPDIERYFMLISEACQLVLQAAAIAKGGELFILDMGKPVKIIDLAQTMIRLYATRPVQIVTTGLRPGEKLYEELLIDESERKTTYESIMIARSTSYDIARLNADIDALAASEDPINALHKMVPEFARHNL